MKVIFLFFQNTTDQTKILNRLNFQHSHIWKSLSTLNEGGGIYGLQRHTGFTTKIKGNPSTVYNFEGICQQGENR